MSRQPSVDKSWEVNDHDFLFDELDQIFETFAEDHPSEQKCASDVEGSPEVSSTDEGFDWEDFKLSGTQELFDAVEKIQPIDSILESAVSQLPLPVNFDLTDNGDVSNNGSPSNTLLNVYGLSDEELSDMSLKQLKTLCKTETDYDDLKAYRRTCQNRFYARSSRSKQQVKTTSLTKELDQSQKLIAELQQENEMKDATIRCLQLELQLLRSVKQE